MLKKFVLNALSAFVGAWLAIFLLGIGFIIFLVGMLNSISSQKGMEVKPHSILKISLEGEIKEIENTYFDFTILMSGQIEKVQTLKNLTAALEYARTNSDIQAVLIECKGVSASPATLDALRDGIEKFKESGKRVFAYGDYLTMGDYFVASVADAVYLNPAGSLDLQGISGTSLYMKDLLDKVGIEVQAVRVGSFKSAVEPYISNEMSDSARLQLECLYDEMWDYILNKIAAERKVKATTIDSLVNNFIFLDQAQSAADYKLVDECRYYREVEDILADYVGVEVENLNLISPEALISPNLNFSLSDNQIAVVYAAGEIAEYNNAGIECHELVPIIVSLANNENVKGMVLRVNSPGGSVFGSEQIGEALDYFKSKGKPLAVSMGDYAASGGYWISAGADIIYADPLTVTGSIGIFGMVPNISRLADKIGLHPQTVSTNPGVLFPSIFYPMSQQQEDALQKNIDLGYDKFINRVATGRKKSVNYIESIGGGRVWSGIKAKELGLVDELGGIKQAEEWVASKAGISSYELSYYPQPEDNFWSALAASMAENAEIRSIMEELNTSDLNKRAVRAIEWFLKQHHVQARCPYYKIDL